MHVQKNKWLKLALKYTDNQELANAIYNEIQDSYSSSGRYYHTLEHIDKLLAVFEEFKDKIGEKDAVEFAIWYHDIIYVPGRTDNETESARLAEKRMRELGIEAERISKTVQLIEATKTHRLTAEVDNFDGQFFLDADLSILGADWENYLAYAKDIRKEFSFVDKDAYAAGRGAVIQEFLRRERIYLTDELSQKLEGQARENIRRELAELESLASE